MLTMDAIPELMEELNLHAKFDGGTVTYPVLKLNTFNLFYIPMLQYMVESWEELCSRKLARVLVAKSKAKVAKKTKSVDAGDDDEEYRMQNAVVYGEMIGKMKQIVDRFFALIELTKSSCLSERNTSILLTALREGKKFIESFIKSEKLIAALFSINTPAVMKAITVLQKATRQLHRYVRILLI